MLKHTLAPITDATIPHATRVLLRSSLNVPIYNSKITDTFRLQQSIRTIAFLQERGAAVTVVGHLGREKQTLRPVWKKLQEHIDISFIPEVTGEKVQNARKKLIPGEALLLENVRTDNRELQNDESLSRELVKDADMFVFDDFSVAHRAQASVVVPIKLLDSYAGIRFQEEITAIKKLLQRKRNQTLVILGGAKIKTKLPLLKKLLNTYSVVFVGGIVANTILKARGISVGSSVAERDIVPEDVYDHPNLLVPHDVVVRQPSGICRITSVDAIDVDDSIIDVGTESIQQLSACIAGMQTVLWNGPLGLYESDNGATQSIALSGIIGERLRQDTNNAFFGLLGGGDTVSLIRENKRERDWSFISTGGGALLHYITHTPPIVL